MQSAENSVLICLRGGKFEKLLRRNQGLIRSKVWHVCVRNIPVFPFPRLRRFRERYGFRQVPNAVNTAASVNTPLVGGKGPVIIRVDWRTRSRFGESYRLI